MPVMAVDESYESQFRSQIVKLVTKRSEAIAMTNFELVICNR